MNWWRQVATVVHSEVQVELRAGDVLWVAVPFGVAVLVVLAMAIGADVPRLRADGPGLYWAVLVVFGTLVSLRQATEEPRERRDAHLLSGLDPAARHLGRAAVAAVVLVVFGLVVLPVVVVLFDPAAAVVVAMLVLLGPVCVGLATLGTLAADLTTAGSSRGMLGSLLVVPLAVPLALAGIQAAEGASLGASPVAWVLLAATMDLAVLAVGVAAAPGLVATARPHGRATGGPA